MNDPVQNNIGHRNHEKEKQQGKGTGAKRFRSITTNISAHPHKDHRKCLQRKSPVAISGNEPSVSTPIQYRPSGKHDESGSDARRGDRKFLLSVKIQNEKRDERNQDDVRSGLVVKGILDKRGKRFVEDETRNQDKCDEARVPSSKGGHLIAGSRQHPYNTSIESSPFCLQRLKRSTLKKHWYPSPP